MLGFLGPLLSVLSIYMGFYEHAYFNSNKCPFGNHAQILEMSYLTAMSKNINYLKESYRSN